MKFCIHYPKNITKQKTKSEKYFHQIMPECSKNAIFLQKYKSARKNEKQKIQPCTHSGVIGGKLQISAVKEILQELLHTGVVVSVCILHIPYRLLLTSEQFPLENLALIPELPLLSFVSFRTRLQSVNDTLKTDNFTLKTVHFRFEKTSSVVRQSQL